ncbi:hypothetical protein ADK82_25745 [Streptomyces sp. NRRL S-4]|nr:hypothetical protein ADK82_25745 [Streptomyces sp. NRRL S-4]
MAQTPGPGRPSSYCSNACRRAAEYELRRIQRALEGVEEQIRACRFGWNGRSMQRDYPKFEEERQRLEARLLELLDDDMEDQHAEAS